MKDTEETAMSELVRILFVDDEENIRKALRRMFRKEPWLMDFAASGAEALEKFEEGLPFDVVVTDQRMPGMSGVELLKELRARYPKTVRMVLSAYTDATTVLEAINEGYVYKFLTKSCSDKVLKEAVTEVVKAVQLAKENRRLTVQVRQQGEEIAAIDWLVDEIDHVDLDPVATGYEAAAFAAAPVGLVMVGEDGRVLTANAEAARVLGCDSPTPLLGTTWDAGSMGSDRGFTVQEAPTRSDCVGAARVLAILPRG